MMIFIISMIASIAVIITVSIICCCQRVSYLDQKLLFSLRCLWYLEFKCVQCYLLKSPAHVTFILSFTAYSIGGGNICGTWSIWIYKDSFRSWHWIHRFLFKSHIAIMVVYAIIVLLVTSAVDVVAIGIIHREVAES